MKIVINGCFGGFGLSEAAYLKYAELKGLTITVVTDKQFSLSRPAYWIGDAATVAANHMRALSFEQREWGSITLDERIAWNREYSTMVLHDIPRDDPALVQTVEELGEAASGRYAVLKVVEIPDGTKWHIEDYDGMETIAEDHRTWE